MQKEQIVPARHAPQEGLEEPADGQNADGRSESQQSVDGKDAQAAADGDGTVPELAVGSDGHAQPGVCAVTNTFEYKLLHLVNSVNSNVQANPFFIRCIKSNPDKIPNKFDEATVIRQVSVVLLVFGFTRSFCHANELKRFHSRRCVSHCSRSRSRPCTMHFRLQYARRMHVRMCQSERARTWLVNTFTYYM